MSKKKIGVLILCIAIVGVAVNLYAYMNREVKLRMYFHPDKLGFVARHIEAFERENPNIKIELVELPDGTNEKYEIMSQALSLEDGNIDIVDSDVIWPSIFVNAGWIEPLDSYFTEAELDQLLTSAVNAGKIGDQLYGIPYRIDSGMLYYRKDLLDKYGQTVPKTWEQLIQVSKEIMPHEEDVYGIAGSWAKFEGLTCNYLEFLWGYDGEVLNANGESTMGTPDAEKALSVMAGLINEHHVAPVEVVDFKSGDVRDMFMDGRLIFMRDWPSGWRQAQNPEVSKVAGKIGVAPLPFGEGHDDSHGTFGGWLFMVSKYSDHKKEAVAFIKYMIQEEVEKDMVMTHNYLPSIKALYQDDEILEKLPYLSEMLPFFNEAFTRPKVTNYDEITYIIQSEVTKALKEESSPEEATKAMDRRISESTPEE